MRQLPIEDPVLERRVAADVDHRRRQPLELAGEELRRRPFALEPVAALVDAEREPRGRPAREVEQRLPAPVRSSCPCRRSTGSSLGCVPIIAGTSPLAGAITRANEVELVAVGLGVEVEGDPVAAVVDERRQLDQRAARMDVGLARARFRFARCPLTALPMSSRSMRSSPMWMSKPGRIGPFLVLGLSLGRRIRIDPLGGDAVDRQLVGEPRAGRPVELDVGRCQEHAARVRDARRCGAATCRRSSRRSGRCGC